MCSDLPKKCSDLVKKVSRNGCFGRNRGRSVETECRLIAMNSYRKNGSRESRGRYRSRSLQKVATLFSSRFYWSYVYLLLPVTTFTKKINTYGWQTICKVL